jgi:DNA-binding XRE family transcriptional regulator
MSTEMTDVNSSAREAEELQDHLDSALLKLARVEQANEETIPFEVVRRLSEGDAPVTVWREHRGLSRQELAMAADIQTDLLDAVEGGKEDVPLRKMYAIACALRVDLDDLVPWSQDTDEATQVAQDR